MANSLSFEGSGKFLGNGVGGGLSFVWSRASQTSKSIEIKKSSTSTIARTGPAQDGVNHDEDAIDLLLNPQVNLDLSKSAADWLLADNSKSAIQDVYVGWLNGHELMPNGVAAALARAAINPEYYPDILARDPLADGSPTLDPARFRPLSTTFPYEPPLNSGDPVPTITTAISASSTETAGTETEDTFKVGLSITTTGDYLSLAKAALKDFHDIPVDHKIVCVHRIRRHAVGVSNGRRPSVRISGQYRYERLYR